MKKLSLALSLSSLLVFGTACSVENTEEIIENAVAAQENLDSYYAEISTTIRFDGEEESSSYKEWHEKPDKYRMEMNDGSIYVSNGEQSWSYDKEENTVLIMDDMVIEEEVAEQEEMPKESEIIREILTEMMDSNNVVVKGKEKIAERNTVHLSLSPKEGQEEELFGGNYEIWIDEETYMPLKMVVGGDDFSSETVYTHIEYNLDIDETLFTFEIPDGATVQTWEDIMPETLTLEELKEKANFDIPEITYLPEGYEFEEATYFADMNMAMLDFVHSEDNEQSITISMTTDPSDYVDENAESIQVGEYYGTYEAMYDIQFLAWNTDTLEIDIVATEHLAKEVLVKVAEGIK